MKKKSFRSPITLTNFTESQQAAVARLAAAAQNFCALYDQPPEDPAQALSFLHRSLAELYAAAVASPSTSCAHLSRHQRKIMRDTAEYRLNVSLKEERSQKHILDIIYEAMGSPYYHMVFDVISDSEAITSGLFEDISSIHHDLGEGLYLWELHQTQLAWHDWRMSFMIHWHQHATGALCYLQEAAVRMENANDPDEPLTLRQILGRGLMTGAMFHDR